MNPAGNPILALARLAVEAAEGAAALLVEHRRRPIEGVSAKSGPTDLVSDADRAAERHIVEFLRARRPGDGILAEEGSDRTTSTGLTWVIDPLDGTINFLYDIPIWCVSVAVADRAGTVAGAVVDPNRKETFWAARGEGAWLGHRRLAVGDGRDLATSLVGTGFAYDAVTRREQAAVVEQMLGSVRDVRRLGSAALDLCYVASARLDCFYEAQMMEWDKAAGLLIVQEAGGSTAPLADPQGKSDGVVAAGPQLFDEFCRVLRAAGARPQPYAERAD